MGKLFIVIMAAMVAVSMVADLAYCESGACPASGKTTGDKIDTDNDSDSGDNDSGKIPSTDDLLERSTGRGEERFQTYDPNTGLPNVTGSDRGDELY